MSVGYARELLRNRCYITSELIEARIVGFWFRANEEVKPFEAGQKAYSYQLAQSSFDAVSFDDFAPVFGDDDSHSRIW